MAVGSVSGTSIPVGATPTSQGPQSSTGPAGGAQGPAAPQSMLQTSLTQTQRVENRQGTGNVRAGGTGEGNAIASTRPESTGSATAVTNGDGRAAATVPEGAEGNALAQSEGGGDAEAVAGAGANAVAIARAEGDAQAQASTTGNALAISNSVGEASATSEEGGLHALAVAEDIGNANAVSRRGGVAVALARGMGNVVAEIAEGQGSAGNVTAAGLASGSTNAIQNAEGALFVVNASGLDVEVTNHATGNVRFELSEEGLIRLIVNGQVQTLLPNAGTEGFVIQANGTMSGAIALAA